MNWLVITYGKVGCGKRYTLYGDQSEEGVVIRGFKRILEYLEQVQLLLIKVSYLGIYNERMFDLGGDEIKELSSSEFKTSSFLGDFSIRNLEDAQELLSKGNQNLFNWWTSNNTHRSKFHTILTISLETRIPLQKLKSHTISFILTADSSRPTQLNILPHTITETKKNKLFPLNSWKCT